MVQRFAKMSDRRLKLLDEMTQNELKYILGKTDAGAPVD